jgi:hypothetical protein
MCGVRMVPVVFGPLVRGVSGSFAFDAMTPLLSLRRVRNGTPQSVQTFSVTTRRNRTRRYRWSGPGRWHYRPARSYS